MSLVRSKVIVLCGALVMFGVFDAHAQSAEPRLAAGAHYSALALDYPDQTRSGIGGWLAYDVSRWFGLDGAVSVFPSDDEISGRQWQGLAGFKAGWRGERLGLFGKVRPGAIHFSERFIAPETLCPLIFPPPEGCLIDSTSFILDAGGVLEVYPTGSVILRIDVGDSAIRFDRAEGSPEWTHNLQMSVGAGWRF